MKHKLKSIVIGTALVAVGIVTAGDTLTIEGAPPWVTVSTNGDVTVKPRLWKEPKPALPTNLFSTPPRVVGGLTTVFLEQPLPTIYLLRVSVETNIWVASTIPPRLGAALVTNYHLGYLDGTNKVEILKAVKP